MHLRVRFQYKLMYALQTILAVCFILFEVAEVWRSLMEDITDHARHLITEKDGEKDAKWTFKSFPLIVESFWHPFCCIMWRTSPVWNLCIL